jgi:tetratricopeptide (TPR) repeat protein
MHLGYQDPSLRRQKIARNLSLLRLEMADNPNDAFTLFNLAGSHLDCGDVEQAIPHLLRCLELAPTGVTFLPKTFVLLTRAFHFLGRIDEALQHCREGAKRFPEEPELKFEEGSLLQARGDLAGARECYETILKMRPQGTFVGVDGDLYGCRTRHNLALVYRGISLPGQAEEQWLAAIEQAPEHGPVWLGLLEHYLDTKRPKDIDMLLARLDQGPYREQISPVLEARLALSRQDLARARRIMEGAILRFPNNLWLRSLLSEILLRVGNDPQAAEMHLRAILEKDPYQKQARQKLDQLLAKQRK